MGRTIELDKADIVRLISPDEAKKMVELGKKAAAAALPILLGICTNRTPCPYGGIDSIAHCGGGAAEGEVKPCAEVLYYRDRLDLVENLERVLDERLANVQVDSPLKASLEAQKRSAENYRHVIAYVESSGT